ncbi:MAG TPA: ubiquinol oxidase subunit II [Verrucomicrobiae bacterium]|nr:ubiquinol oxidase subunit II [Verrucomicrobiae bacterium]
MFKGLKAVLLLVSIAALALLFTRLVSGSSIPVLQPKGIIGQQQMELMKTAVFLMLLVVIPVFILTFAIAWRYRADNTKATYTPNWDHNHLAEFTWWAIPCVIILALAVITWKSSHDLDPFKPLESSAKPLTVQVVALPWKWLFIYPEQNIATVNHLTFPEDVPLHFEITADAPMNSFWIPQLGGQIYAMTGMVTELNLMAAEKGTFAGSSANLSGEGFADMKFTATATSQADFDQWVTSTQQSQTALSMTEYTKLAVPSKDNPPTSYSFPTTNLHHNVVMKYMAPDTKMLGADHATMQHGHQ